MNPYVASALLGLLKMITSGALMDHLIEFVSEVANLQISGEDKRRAVLQRLNTIGGDLQPVIAATASYVLNLALETAVAYVRSHSEIK